MGQLAGFVGAALIRARSKAQKLGIFWLACGRWLCNCKIRLFSYRCSKLRVDTKFLVYPKELEVHCLAKKTGIGVLKVTVWLQQPSFLSNLNTL